MDQQSLFDNTPFSILPHNRAAIIYPGFFSAEESTVYFARLLKEINRKQEPVKVFGKEIMQPRPTAWYGDTEKTSGHSGITMQPQTWNEPLIAIK